ncbi:unnamed protein product [Arctia plantaginis]|uniref:Nuclear receptor domain-containing protein n=1 Tax=Arctia plantaginis TaxID=874455 RepID=A0A8S1BA21_ARCPL|nr:unnamed protein product [Arctia plantaginis]
MNQQCKVCGEPAAGFHFGAFTCEGCKVVSQQYLIKAARCGNQSQIVASFAICYSESICEVFVARNVARFNFAVNCLNYGREETYSDFVIAFRIKKAF